MSSFPCSNLPPDSLQESSCCCVPAWPSDLGGTGKYQGLRVDLFFCKGKIRKNRVGEEHKLLFDFSLPWEYFSSGSQTEKKQPKPKKNPLQQSRKNWKQSPVAWFGNIILSYPSKQELFLWPWEVGSFTLIPKEEQVLSDNQVTLSPFSIWPVTRHCGNELGIYCVTGILENLSFLHSEMTVPALRSHVISRWFRFCMSHCAFWF